MWGAAAFVFWCFGAVVGGGGGGRYVVSLSLGDTFWFDTGQNAWQAMHCESVCLCVRVCTSMGVRVCVRRD